MLPPVNQAVIAWLFRLSEVGGGERRKLLPGREGRLVGIDEVLSDVFVGQVAVSAVVPSAGGAS